MTKTAKKLLRSTASRASAKVEGGRDEATTELVVKNNYLAKISKLKKTVPDWDHLFDESQVTPEERVQQLIRVEVLGQPLAEKYAWAIPSDRALKILAHFSPLIEIGCGKRYWGYLLEHLHQCTVVGFDKVSQQSKGEKTWGTVLNGGPEKLADPLYKGHTLFLCYPDEDSSLAEECLESYDGDYVLHVGELLSTGGTLSHPQSPWGRTSGAQFQVTLAEQFHCVLATPLPRFPFSRDSLTVWKRTQWVCGKEQDNNVSNGNHEENDDENDDGEDGSEKEDEEKSDDFWAAIPAEEQVEVQFVAPFLQHLFHS